MQGLKKNFTYNVIYQALIVVFPIVITPYVSRVLGVSNLGVYGYTSAIAAYFALFAKLGINAHGNRIIAKSRENRDEMSKNFLATFMIQIILGILMTIIYILYVLIFINNNKVIFLIQGINIIACIFDITWFFQGLERFGVVIFRNVLVKIMTGVAIFTLVKSKEDLLVYTVILAVSQLVGFIIVFPYIKNEINFINPVKIRLRSHLKPITILFLPVIATSLFTSLDTIFVGIFSGVKQVGFYTMALSVVTMPKAIIGALGTTMLPRMSNIYAQSSTNSSKVANYLNITIMFTSTYAIGAMFGIIGVANVLIPIFLGPGYNQSILFVQILSIQIPFYAWGNLVRTQILIPKNEDKPYVISIILGAFVNIVINLILIPQIGALGAVIATVITEITLSVYEIIYVRNELKIKEFSLFILACILSGIIMMWVILMSNIVLKEGIGTLILQVLIGGVVFLILMIGYLLLSKNKIISDIKK
ncbi:polysaccharide biosynthesis C-terminal domain-containing protein [Dellaglioa algida]|uniref:Polysaccharide biosynthesis protein n=1 Tax=Dellaglioa algida TaxID=105612 RepID=A0A5C6MAW0_9LACO|nr:polysaccharide biosynthesis C-terminal domain-containing protein [Dellaglioa algida]MDK1717140.1 polysaccharide biosynthesis C-terminal domain-containing protein [Dellaglioa algida]MDK1719790.1 polysaccharide biosynthesis C-terminal domain-containing protein [Dellaglioa algida]MDK1722082.1 polysaccharide biosynthesis C-terminal domain-containing protein [Dellaglioa algida]MDK1723133.1 polysaccharide biosynthesis C-terminal domain-containing protein [Dellaglioa algida]MDK1739915.1 polysaccha